MNIVNNCQLFSDDARKCLGCDPAKNPPPCYRPVPVEVAKPAQNPTPNP